MRARGGVGVEPRSRWWALSAGALILATGACSQPDPKRVLEVQDLEGYWTVVPSRDSLTYISPTLRLRVKNSSADPLTSVQALASFRRKGEEGPWGSCFVTVSTHSKPLAPGAVQEIELTSDGTYHSPAPAAKMFDHGLFRDATVEVFFRTGSSWVKFGSLDVPRHIGRPGNSSG